MWPLKWGKNFKSYYLKSNYTVNETTRQQQH